MANEKTEENKSTTGHQKSLAKREEIHPTTPSVASSLAGMFLEQQVNKGREIEIPSLGIKVGKSKPDESPGSEKHDYKTEKKETSKTNDSSS